MSRALQTALVGMLSLLLANPLAAVGQIGNQHYDPTNLITLGNFAPPSQPKQVCIQSPREFTTLIAGGGTHELAGIGGKLLASRLVTHDTPQKRPLSYGYLRDRSDVGSSAAGIPTTMSSEVATPAVSCPTTEGYVASIEYRAYIPADHAYGNPSYNCGVNYQQPYAVYYGDQPYDQGLNTYRVSIYTLSFPGDVNIPATGETADVGTTYQFADNSPINGPYLTPTDYDGTFNDCNLENDEGQAVFGINGSEYTIGYYLGNEAAGMLYVGQLADPFIPLDSISIGWNLTTTIVDIPNTYSMNVQVSGGVTCYPAHEMLINGASVANYQPLTNNPIYIASCLALPANTSMNGPATFPGGTTISVF